MMYTADFIKEKLSTSDKWLIRGMLAVYERQTADEQASGETSHDNGVGFNGVDAPLLSSFSEFYQTRGFLSPKQVMYASKKMMKYNH